ncbi:hypothetical protein F4859DRAFT_382887 [Xylaria cf. heliscus]|nr:hypothetical protein F4859DRAFT_382887 [Xylaria cf. heliscus]
MSGGQALALVVQTPLCIFLPSDLTSAKVNRSRWDILSLKEMHESPLHRQRNASAHSHSVRPPGLAGDLAECCRTSASLVFRVSTSGLLGQEVYLLSNTSMQVSRSTRIDSTVTNINLA